MAVVVIDVIKPKNQGTFPIVEDVDVLIKSSGARLSEVVATMATQAQISALQTAVNGKASQSDLNALSTTVAGKQNALSEEQLAAANSGITSELVTQIGTNTTAIAGKASQADLSALELEVNGKANTSDLTTATANLQGQIDQIEISASAESVVAPEVAAARVGFNGTEYATLKQRLDAESSRLVKGSTSNLFDKSRIYTGKLSGNYGNIQNWNNYHYSDYIKSSINKVYFNQCPSTVCFYNSGVLVGSYAASSLILDDGWYSTPNFTSVHDGFAFDYSDDAEIDIDTLMVSSAVLDSYTAFTGYTTIYGDENAFKQDLHALSDSIAGDFRLVRSSISGIDTSISAIENDIDEINANVKYRESPNILDTSTILVGKRPTTTKGEYESAAWASTTTPMPIVQNDKIYFNFTPYQLSAWNAQGELVGTAQAFTDEGGGWKSVRVSWANSDSITVFWNNTTGGFDIDTSMITRNVIPDHYEIYGEGYPMLFNERVALYSEIPVTNRKKCTVLSGAGKSVNYRISNTIEVGDLLETVSAQWRSVISCNIPNGAIGAYVAGTNDKTYPKYAVTDSGNKVLLLADYDAASTDTNGGYYIDMSNVEGAAGLTFECSSNSQSLTVFWVYNKDEFNIYPGEKQSVTFSSATATKRIENNMPVMVREFSDASKTETLTFAETQHCRNVGLWLKVSDYNSLEAISGVKISLYMDDALATTDETENPQFLQMCNWVFLKARTLDYDFNKIKITVTFSDTTKNLFMEIGAYPIINHFNRPIMAIDFDHTWQQTADCGAYDDLIDNGVPFTITGHMEHYLEKLTEAYQAGLLDIGSYAGNADGTTINNLMTVTEIMAALDERIDTKISEGYDAPSSFGGGGHVIFPKLRRALEMCGYKSIKGGTLGGINSVTSSDPRYIYLGCSTTMAMTLGGVYFLFTHGVSSNPSGETDPSLFMSYTDFTTILTAITTNVNSGGALVLNMKQFTEFMENHKLIEQEG